jgi:hypothetical protein
MNRFDQYYKMCTKHLSTWVNLRNLNQLSLLAIPKPSNDLFVYLIKYDFNQLIACIPCHYSIMLVHRWLIVVVIRPCSPMYCLCWVPHLNVKSSMISLRVSFIPSPALPSRPRDHLPPQLLIMLTRCGLNRGTYLTFINVICTST